MPTRTGVLITVIALAAAVHAAPIYKSVGPDGRVTYSDRPPPDGVGEKTLNFSNLPASPLPESVIRYREELEKRLKDKLSRPKPVRSAQPVLFSATWCGQCRKAKTYLAEHKIRYIEYDIDTEDGMSAYIEAGGKRGVPLLSLRGKTVLGFTPEAYDVLLGSQ